MPATPAEERTFDREEVALILREAAAIEPRSAALPAGAAAGDGLTLQEIERAAAEVGITRNAVAAASLRVALRSAHAGGARHHSAHRIAGTLDGASWDALASELRARTSPANVRCTADGLDFELPRTSGDPAALLVQMREGAGTVSIEIWSEAPRSGRGDLVGYAAIGAPALLFPVVAVSAGQWPALGLATALGSAGAAAGAALGLAFQRWQRDRWRARLEQIIVPLVERATELAVGDGEPSAR